jgi:hypothetical protein
MCFAISFMRSTFLDLLLEKQEPYLHNQEVDQLTDAINSLTR